MTCLDPCGDDPILYTVGTNDTWTHSMDDVLLVQMLYADESGKLMLQHPSLSEIKSQLSSSGSDENHKKHSTAVIKRGFYMGSCSDVTPLLTQNGCYVMIGKKKYIQMDGLLVRNTNPFDYTIKAGMYVRIYYENFPGMSEDESLKIPYPVEVLNCLVDVSTGGTFCWVRVFENHVDVFGRGHLVPGGVNLHPHEVFYTKQGLLIPTEIIDGEYTCVSFNIYFSFLNNLFIVSNVILCCVVGIVDVLFTVSSIKRWGTSTRKGDFFFVVLLLRMMIITPLFNFLQQKVTMKLSLLD